MKKLMLGLMVLFFLFIGCGMDKVETEIVHTGVIKDIVYNRATFMEFSHYVIEFENGLMFRLAVDTKGDLPIYDIYFNVTRHERFSSVWYTLEKVK